MRSARVHRRAVITPTMPVSRRLPTVLLLGLLAVPAFCWPAVAAPALAAEAPERTCLTKAEQRTAVAARKAIPLAQAIKSLRDQGQRADVVRARLCRRNEALVYVLTLLGSSGKVSSATVDAANGEFHIGR